MLGLSPLASNPVSGITAPTANTAANTVAPFNPSNWNVYDRTMYGVPLTNEQLDMDWININNAMAEDTPTIVDVYPSLNLDFANAGVLDPRITFARSSTATYYDGKTQALAEQNLTTNSTNFTGWTANNSSFTQNITVITAPDGTNTATKLIEDSSSNTHNINITTTGLNAGVYTWSVYAQAAERSWLVLTLTDTSAHTVYYDLVNGWRGYTDAASSSTMTSMGNGWYRCTFTITLTAGPNTNRAQIGIAQSNFNNSYTGDNTSGIYIWGAQLENRSAVTAYTPTTSSTITNYIPVLMTSANNVARFDYDPLSGSAKGLLIEQSSTNLITYSSDYSNTVWSKGGLGSIEYNKAIAPDGTQTATKVTFGYPGNTEAWSSVNGSPVACSPNTTYTGSCYAKYISGNPWIAAWGYFGNVGDVFVIYNLITGSITTTSNATGSITPVGNGWYKITWTATSGATTSYAIFLFFQSNGNYRTLNYQGSDTFYIWGAQLEQSSFPTSYIPTGASTVTRGADNVNIRTSGWYNNLQGTWYSNSTRAQNNATLFIVAGNSSLYQHYFHSSGGAATYDGTNILTTNSLPLISYHQISSTYGNSGQSLTANGATPTTSAYNSSFGNNTSFSLGSYNLSNCLNGWIKKLQYYPKQLSNSQIQYLTGRN